MESYYFVCLDFPYGSREFNRASSITHEEKTSFMFLEVQVDFSRVKFLCYVQHIFFFCKKIFVSWSFKFAVCFFRSLSCDFVG